MKPLGKYIELLKELTPDKKSEWGIMSAQHMIEHILLAVQMSNGKLVLECFNGKEKLPMLKRYLMSSRPLPKGFVNPYNGEGLLPLKFTNLVEAITELEKEVNDYYNYFDENPEAKLTNVTFGELEKDEWGVFHDKHFTHHLKQFGLVLTIALRF